MELSSQIYWPSNLKPTDLTLKRKGKRARELEAELEASGLMACG